jgi:hypothetical protein
VAFGTIKKSPQGGFSGITVPSRACDTALKVGVLFLFIRIDNSLTPSDQNGR